MQVLYIKILQYLHVIVICMLKIKSRDDCQRSQWKGAILRVWVKSNIINSNQIGEVAWGYILSCPVLHSTHCCAGRLLQSVNCAVSLFLYMIDPCLPLLEEQHHGRFRRPGKTIGLLPWEVNLKEVISSLSPFLYSDHPWANFLTSVEMRKDVGSEILKCYLISL